MKLPQAAMMAVIAASAASAFQTHFTHHAHTSSNAVGPATRSMTTALNAFQLKEGETHNMFEGPLALVRERDACGVGFIANTNSGGE